MIETNARAEALIASGEVDRAIAAIRIDPAYAIAIAEEGNRQERLKARQTTGADLAA